MQRLGQILQRHSLTAANSWSAATGPSYFHSDYAARIDYFLLRLQSCDGIAKQAHYLNQAEFLPLNQTHHFPLVCTIPKKHMIFQSKQFAPACSYRQRAQCRSASEQETDGWIALSQEVAHQCNRYLSQAPQSQTCIHDLHQDILPFFKQLFPGKPPTFSNTDQSAVHLPIENKWMHRKCIQNISHQQGSHGLHACLKAWYHWGRFRSLQRQQQRSIRQARAQRFATLCTEATAAAHLHDSHTLFQIINRHTPKRPITKARLKTDDGRIADQYMAHALTVQHVQQTWQGADTLQPLSDQPPGVPMEVQDIEQAIMTLHPNKSVAGPYLPAIIWKSAPKELAALIHQLLTRWWSCADPYIPPEWRDACLFFLPKPGKPCTHPSQLRPISLMERIGKLVLGILTEKLKRFHQDHLCSEPQFGFLPKRSALDAIARVTRHCNLIRTLVAMQRRTFARQRTTKPEHTFCGGLQLLLDLRQAFDTVNRPRLFRFLQQRGTPTDLLHIISSWHMDTHYNLIHNNTTTRIPVNVGLRQGCKAAPILWVLFMSHFVELLQEHIDPLWLQEALTMYADDIHLGATFYNKTEFQLVLTRLGRILDVLESMQLQLSYDKTFVILATAGSNVTRGLKGAVERRKTGMVILLPRERQQPSAIPLRASGKYLGIVVSYGTYELLTWRHRMKAARIAFARLRCWFKSKQFFTQHRVHLWMVCVHSIMTYGLSATNVTVKVLHEYQLVYQMMRQVLHDHAYISRHSHQQVFEQFDIASPLALLASHVSNFWRRLQRRALTLPSTDFLHKVDWSHLPGLIRLIQCVADTAIEAPISSDAAAPVRTQALHRCHACSFTTWSVANLRRHQTQHHGISQYRTSPVSPLDFALHGQPQCRNCLQVFTTWRRFFIHIERNCCQVMARPDDAVPGAHALVGNRPTPADARPPERSASTDPYPLGTRMTAPIAAEAQIFWPLLREVVQTSAYHRLQEDPQIGNFLAHNCVICGTWCNRCQELHSHFRLNHPHQLPGVLARSAQITHQVASPTPCVLCQKPYKRNHSCPVATQVASLQLHGQDSADNSDALRTCIICDLLLPDMAQLHQHLGRCHELQIPDWCPARDSLQGSDACAHCGALFETRSGLRRHILDGRCERFDPAASPQPLDAATKWSEVLQQGELTRSTLTPAQRQDLTLVCQLCGQRYGRQNDLGAHLQHAHSQLWQASQETLRFLIQAVQAKHGCQCNPSCHEQGRTHVCTLLRQFSMIFMLSQQETLVPTQFIPDKLQVWLQHIDQLPMYRTIHDTLYTRQFEDLWQQPGLAGFLSSWCIQCGLQHHPAALVVHHWQQHRDQSQWAAQIKFQIVTSMLGLQDQDTTCNFCGQPVNLPTDPANALMPERFIALQIHFASNCPVVHQAAQLLLPLDGRDDARPGSERHGPSGILQGAGSSPSSGQPLPKRPRRGTTLQASQTRNGPRGGRPTGRQTAGPGCHGGHDESDGQAIASTRTEHPTSPSTGLLRFLCPSQSTRSGPTTDTGSRGMDGLAPEEPRQSEGAHTQNTSHEDPDERNPSPSATDEHQQQGCRTLGQSSRTRSTSPRRVVAVPTMEPFRSSTDPSGPTTPADGSTPETTAAHGRVAGGFHACDQIPIVEGAANSHSLVSPDMHADRRDLADLDRAATAGDVESLRTHIEGSSTRAMQTSAALTAMSPTESQQPQGQREGESPWQAQEPLDTKDIRKELRQAIQSLTMDNSGNWCYANSAVLAYLWATLSRITFQMTDWGEFSELFHAMLSQPVDTPIMLEQCQWFQRLIASWPERHGQADSTEFSNILLKGVASPSTSNRWERRVIQEQKVEVHDMGDRFMPITIPLDPELTDNGSIRLVDLIRNWHNELGMSAGLMDAADIICIHVDRFLMLPSGQLTKSTTPIGFHWGVPFPTFTNGPDGTECFWEGFQVVAASAHLGSSDAGHYQCILRVGHEARADQDPALWLHCDDNRQPKPCWYLPPEFAAGVTCFWLCKCDSLELHDMRDSPCPVAGSEQRCDASDHQDMLTMLNSLPSSH